MGSWLWYCCWFGYSFGFGVLIVQIFAFSRIKDLQKKSSDKIGAMVVILNAVSNTAMAAGFGKSYTPMTFSIIGLAITLFVCIGYPSLCEWCATFFAAATPLRLGIQYFRNGLQYGRTSSRILY